jgi:hypothetical protein
MKDCMQQMHGKKAQSQKRRFAFFNLIDSTKEWVQNIQRLLNKERMTYRIYRHIWNAPIFIAWHQDTVYPLLFTYMCRPAWIKSGLIYYQNYIEEFNDTIWTEQANLLLYQSNFDMCLSERTGLPENTTIIICDVYTSRPETVKFNERVYIDTFIYGRVWSVPINHSTFRMHGTQDKIDICSMTNGMRETELQCFTIPINKGAQPSQWCSALTRSQPFIRTRPASNYNYNWDAAT